MRSRRIFPLTMLLIAWITIATMTGVRAQIARGASPPTRLEKRQAHVTTRLTAGSDFTLSVSPSELDVCTPGDAVFTVGVGQVQGFSDPVTLYTTQQPAGTTTDFSVNPVFPPGTSLMTIGNTGVLSAGVYSIVVDGTAPTVTHSAQASLLVYTNVPDQPVLLVPLDGDSDVPLQTTFIWSPSDQGGAYNLEVALDSNFSDIVIAETGLQGITFTASTGLDPQTTYYWRVQSENICGLSGFSDMYSFSTQSTPAHYIYLPMMLR